MTSRDRWAAALAGGAAGFFGGLFGVGGGIILVPILTGMLRFTQHQAHATSLAVIVFTALTAGAVYAAHGNVAWSVGIAVAVAATLAAPLGARLAARLSPVVLKRSFAVLLALVGARLLWTPPQGGGHAIHGSMWLVAHLATGLAVGILAGLMGVGGGIIAVPIFTLLFGLPQHLAQGTSLLVVLGAAASGTWEHSRRGAVVWRIVPWLALGAALGGLLASGWAQHLPGPTLARAFSVVMLATALHGWIQSGRLRAR